MLLIENLKIVTLFTLGLFAIFLFSYGKGVKRVNVMLAAIYGFQALEALNSTFYRFSSFWVEHHPWVFYSTEFTLFLWGPAIYFFFTFSFDKTRKWRKLDWLHLLPALIHTVFLFARFHLHTNAEKIVLLENGVMSPTEDFVIHLLRNVAVIIYLVIATIQMRKKALSSPIEKSWITFFLVAFYVVELIQILHFIDLQTRTYNKMIYDTTAILWFGVAIGTLYKAMNNPFSQVSAVHVPVKGDKPREKVVEDPSEFDQILNKIVQLVETEQRFLDPELTLSTLAKSIDIPVKKVSYVINEHNGKSVPDYLNELRIDKAKQLLSDHTSTTMNVIEVAYEVGFNSKATFNRSFTKFTGQSPTQFRNANGE